ncbi:MAG: hypothetical protein JW874_15340 [Spirochaetales bacterium]|nr:hypothetical protein [Spirochaetales bacterium]
MKTIKDYREFLKGDLWEGFDTMQTDQRKGRPAAPSGPAPVRSAPTITRRSTG